MTGSDANPGETASLLFDGSTIGAATVDGFGNFSISGEVPESATPGTYEITVEFDGGGAAFTPCFLTVSQAAASDDDDDADDDDDDAAADDDDDAEITPAAPAAPQQQQQQQQQTILPVAIPAVAHAPVAHSSGGGILPKTGSRTQAMGMYGAATLLAGLVLVAFSRRARLALGTVGAAVLRRTPASEADLLLPYRSDDQ